MVFRFRREQKKTPSSSLPFTEMPEELKPKPPTFGHVVRSVLNTLFLILLGIALVAMVAAFAYELAFHPDILVAWSNQFITSLQNLFQSFSSVLK